MEETPEPKPQQEPEKRKVTLTFKKSHLFYVLAAVLLVVGFTAGYFGAAKMKGVTGASVAGQKVLDFVNNNLAKPGTSASLGDIKDLGFIYQVNISYQGQDVPLYVTKDGKYLFLGAYDLEPENIPAQEQEPPKQTVPKSEKPDVKLFVMSYCPYGLQAEKALLPVIELLGSKANIAIHFVYYAMHGDKEVYENLRQHCIQKEQNDKYYDYLLCFVQSGDYESCLQEAGIDTDKLSNCMNETDKQYNITANLENQSAWLNGRFPPFDIDLSLNQQYGVQGSPTLVINDQVVQVNRSPEAMKEVICSAFENPPEECNQNLSTEVTSPGIGQMSGSATSSSGQCN